MRFKVLKSGPDGISGGSYTIGDITDVLREVLYFRGWPSMDVMHANIRQWSEKARPGDVFCTQASAVVAVPSCDGGESECPNCLSEDVDFGELEPVEGGHIEQNGKCLNCNHQWRDVFVWSERNETRRGSLKS